MIGRVAGLAITAALVATILVPARSSAQFAAPLSSHVGFEAARLGTFIDVELSASRSGRGTSEDLCIQFRRSTVRRASRIDVTESGCTTRLDSYMFDPTMERARVRARIRTRLWIERFDRTGDGWRLRDEGRRRARATVDVRWEGRGLPGPRYSFNLGGGGAGIWYTSASVARGALAHGIVRLGGFGETVLLEDVPGIMTQP